MFEGLLQPGHLLLIFFVALLVFGPKKLPELGKGLGEAIRGFKKAMEDEQRPAPLPEAERKSDAEPAAARDAEPSTYNLYCAAWNLPMPSAARRGGSSSRFG
jgi:sec-independent protein translocase protein TatA